MSSLDDSERFCRSVVERSGSSFRRSFDFLNAEARRAMDAVYAFARLIDDLADGTEPAADEDTQFAMRLHEWIDSLDATSPTPAVPMRDTPAAWADRSLQELTAGFDRIAESLADSVARFRIDRRNLHALVEGAKWDLLAQPMMIADEKELWSYCHAVASSVGLICVSIWRGDPAACEPPAVAAGHAFQLTNILRDVAEDARRGRIYLPLDQLNAFGCDQNSWLRCEPAGDWRGLMRRYIAYARERYAESLQVLPHLPADGQRMYSLMWTTYRELLVRIESDLDCVWTTRIGLPRSRKARIYLAHAFTPWFERGLQTKLRAVAAS